MSEVHHFVLRELKTGIVQSVPIKPLLSSLLQHKIINHEEEKNLKGKGRKGMRVLISKLHKKDFQTFTTFVQCILEAGGEDCSVNTTIVNCIRGAAENFDSMHNTDFTPLIPRKEYDPGVFDSDEEEDDQDDKDETSSSTSDDRASSGYASNSPGPLSSTPPKLKSDFATDQVFTLPVEQSGNSPNAVNSASKAALAEDNTEEDTVNANSEIHKLMHGYERYLVDDMEETGEVFGRGLYGRVLGVTVDGKRCIAKEYEYDKVNAFITNCGFHSSLRHRNVIGFVGTHYQPTLVIILEKMEMNFNRVMGLPNLSYSIKLSILHDISEGILYLHTRSPTVVHCDISPRHVLFTRSLCAKISAFNFSTILSADSAEEGSMNKPYVNPVQQLFNPPEVNDAITPKFDIYSFGMMCINMLLGSGRFQEVHYSYSTKFNLDGIEESLQGLIRRCIAYDRGARPDSLTVAQEMKRLSVQTPRRLNDIIEAINPTSDIEVSLISRDYMQVEQLKHEDAYNDILSKGESLNMKFLKFFFLGLPRTGKTSTRKRITGKIDDIKSSPQDPDVQEPSTGAVEVPRKIILRKATASTAVVTSNFEWHFTADLNDEARMLNKLLFEVSGSFHQSRGRKRSMKNGPTTLKATLDLKLESTDLHDTGSGGLSIARKVEVSAKVPSAASAKTSAKKSKLKKTPEVKKFTFSTEIEELFTIFRDAMTTGKWDEVHFVLSGTILLYMIDTGGQSEFLEMLPALTLGPALSLIFFKLNEKLKSLYDVVYVHENGSTTFPYKSEFTVEETMFQILSSIACFSTFGSNKTATKSEEGHRVKLSDALQSASVLVGTHSDKVSKEAIMEVDDYLQQKIRETDFFKRELIQFYQPDQNQMILPINNMSGGKQEVLLIRKFIEDLIDRYFNEIHIPAAWLIFSLCLRKLGKKIISFEECAVIADKLYMNEEELKEALWFLHHSVGSIMHFSELPELQGMIISDLQVIFDSVTRLIVNTYTFGNVHISVQERFKKTGIFSLKDIKRASTSSELIPLKKLVVLLQHINFIARIQSESETTEEEESVESHRYFMPAILKSAPKSELLEMVTTPVPSSPSGQALPSSIMIHYECGYVPIGMFCALIANLVGQGQKFDPKWILSEKEVHKNKVSFTVGVEYDVVNLISHPTYYEITISRPILEIEPPVSPKTATHLLCSQVLARVKTSLKLVCSRMNYPFRVGYNLAFECPSHPERDHLCIVDRDDPSPQLMQCRSPKDHKLLRLLPHHLLWFKAQADAQVPKLKDLILVECKDFHNLGLQLDLSQHSLDIIKQDNIGDIKAFAREMFATWLRREGGEPTYKNLVTALKKVGQKDEAKRISNKFGISEDV